MWCYWARSGQLLVKHCVSVSASASDFPFSLRIFFTLWFPTFISNSPCFLYPEWYNKVAKKPQSRSALFGNREYSASFFRIKMGVEEFSQPSQGQVIGYGNCSFRGAEIATAQLMMWKMTLEALKIAFPNPLFLYLLISEANRVFGTYTRNRYEEPIFTGLGRHK